MPIQVSSSLKSKGERKRLEKRGVTNIPAGAELTDEEIAEHIRNAIHSNE